MASVETTNQKVQLVGESGLSSVELSVNAKGEPQWKIKVYDQDIDKALEIAIRVDEELRERYVVRT